MAEFFKWDPKIFGIKVPEMDHEHMELIKKMNAVYTAQMEQAPKQKISALLVDLANYTAFHFKDEEAYMEKIKYPALESHKVLHQQLLSQIKTYIEEFETSGELQNRFFRFLSGWLATHIRGTDIKYSPSGGQNA